MNIIIPLGGLGERFKQDGYILPKPLVNILGSPMIFHVLDNLVIDSNDIIMIFYNKELKKFSFKETLEKKYKKILFVEINKQTLGAAETILIGLNMIDSELLKRKTILIDCDTFYKYDIVSYFRNFSNNLITCFKDFSDSAIYSYCNVNNENTVIEIQEKVKISNFANTGCYCFLNSLLIKDYAEKIISMNIRQKNEYYISGIISEMIKDNKIFKINIIDSKDFVSMGTPLSVKIYCSNIKKNKEIKRFCFDLDNTLVSYPEINNDYTTVKPIMNNIKLLKKLKSQGHYIIIYTARRMKTHSGNIGKIIADIGKITIDTLKLFNIPYDELVFGKPYADFYIDDKAINCFNDIQKEIGFYFTNIEERDFNEIKFDNIEIVTKKSANFKIQGEIFFYKNIPDNIKQYFPLFVNSGSNWYSIEKINGITFSYLYLSHSLSEPIFNNLLNTIELIHSSSKINENDNTENIYLNYCEKIKKRYETFNYDKYENSKLVFEKIYNLLKNYELNNKGIKGLIHGDPVFTNILLDGENKIKLIDMRGILGETHLSIYGDIFYDYAKIYQSLIGYDEILLEQHIKVEYKTHFIGIFEKYINDTFGSEYFKYIQMITNSLLFSLIPINNLDKSHQYYNLINIEISDH